MVSGESTHVIQAISLTKHFGSHVAVDDVSFSISRGEIFGFLGPNGSGKSTIIKMLCGILQPTSGTGIIEGRDTFLESMSIRRSLGYVSQKFGLYSDLTARENLEFYGSVYGVRAARLERRIQELSGLTRLSPYLDTKAGNLSGGWKQRLAITAAMLHRPSVIFLDEPTAGIDPVARYDIWNLLFDFSREGITMFVTTHYMDEAQRCNRVGYIYLSRLITCGSPQELIAAELGDRSLEDVFVRMTRQLQQ